MGGSSISVIGIVKVNIVVLSGCIRVMEVNTNKGNS